MQIDIHVCRQHAGEKLEYERSLTASYIMLDMVLFCAS